MLPLDPEEEVLLLTETLTDVLQLERADVHMSYCHVSCRPHVLSPAGYADPERRARRPWTVRFKSNESSSNGNSSSLEGSIVDTMSTTTNSSSGTTTADGSAGAAQGFGCSSVRASAAEGEEGSVVVIRVPLQLLQMNTEVAAATRALQAALIGAIAGGPPRAAAGGSLEGS